MKATLRYREKLTIKDRYVIEMTLHEINDRSKYRNGLKYGLICFDLKTGKRVLMDNHHPKKDHVHIDNLEYEYDFQGVDKLVEDFKALVLKHLGIKL